MLAYAVRRVLATVPLLVLGTFIVYVLVAVSGDPLAKLATCNTCDQSAFDRIIDLYDLDKPIPERYANWIVNAVQGDFGPAVSFGSIDAGELVLERAANSARLAIPAFLIIVTIAITLGVYSAVNQYSRLDYAVTGLSFLGISLPTFVFALLLLLGGVTLTVGDWSRLTELERDAFPFVQCEALQFKGLNLSAYPKLSQNRLQPHGDGQRFLARAEGSADEFIKDPHIGDQRLVSPLRRIDQCQGLDTGIDDKRKIPLDSLQVVQRQRRARRA